MKIITRDALYQQVWSAPMNKVAMEYGLTGGALKTICNRHHIPAPPPGYWQKFAYGKPVTRELLPTLTDERLDQVRIAPASHVSEDARQALEQARRGRKERKPPAKPPTSRTLIKEPAILVATRQAISKAPIDEKGFATASGHGVVSLKIAPASIDRCLNILDRLLTITESYGFYPLATDRGLVLVVEDEPILFGLEELTQRVLRPPAAAQKRLDRKAQPRRYGRPPPKYDYTPSGRLALAIDTRAYPVVRRTFADGKNRALEDLLHEAPLRFLERATRIKKRRQANQEQDRQRREAAAHRQRNVAFENRERRRVDFLNVVHTRLAERSRLSAVLTHLENAEGEDSKTVDAMRFWIRRRLQQTDALISPSFLSMSAQSAKVDFVEPRNDAVVENQTWRTQDTAAELRLWSVDAAGRITAKTALEWTIEVGLLPRAALYSDSQPDQANDLRELPDA